MPGPQVQASKKGTGRVVVRSQLGLENSYTVEASFAGTSKDRVHFSINDLQVCLDSGTLVIAHCG